MQRLRWADADIDVVELLAFGSGLVVGGIVGALGRVGAIAAMVGGTSLLIRAIRAGHRRPWWHTTDGPGSHRDGSDDDG